MKKRRFSFWKVGLWVTAINIFFVVLTLIMVFYVKLPNTTVDIKADFNIPRYLLRAAVSLIYQWVFYFFALNRFYCLMKQRARWLPYVLTSLVFLVICMAYSFLYALTIRQEDLKIDIDISLKIFSFVLSALFHLGLAIAITAIARQLDEKRSQAENQKLLEQRAFRLEKEKMQADYLFLKAQVNPHFLHNTLNFLYARSLPYSPELSEGILTLSEIMRYGLDNHEDSNGKVLLTQEIGHVHNVIRMQQLRFDNSLLLQFTMEGNPDGQRILPFVLITLVENAFKHGDLKSTDNPVKITLTVHPDGQLHFTCTNKKKTGPKELSTGIGLDNTRKRLDLAYGENYSLYIKDQRDLYTTDLTIKL